jgi:hypothetical protein
MNKYMLDTTLFNDVLDGEVSIAPCSKLHLLVTGIQLAQLQATKCSRRRARLLITFEQVNPDSLPASSFAFGIEGAGFDEAYFNDGSGNFEKMLDRLRKLDSCDKKKRKSKDQLGKEKDILIAETAIKNRATLVSKDKNLRIVVSEFGGRAIGHATFEREAIAIAGCLADPSS